MRKTGGNQVNVLYHQRAFNIKKYQPKNKIISSTLCRSKRVKHQTTETYDGVEVKLHLILTSALDIISILASSD
jgi:hypothetical protein